MGNGFTDNDGYELSRNSTRHASVNTSVKEAQDFYGVVRLWREAVRQDKDLLRSLGNDANIVIEETARNYYEHVDDKPELPVDWKQHVLDMQSQAMMLRLQRPR